MRCWHQCKALAAAQAVCTEDSAQLFANTRGVFDLIDYIVLHKSIAADHMVSIRNSNSCFTKKALSGAEPIAQKGEHRYQR